MGLLDKIKNYYFPVVQVAPSQAPVNRENDAKDLRNYIGKVQLARVSQDILSWRNAINESELAWYPQRVKMQQMYLDTSLNGHVFACMEKRKDLTRLRDFHVCDEEGNTLEEPTKLISKTWFYQMIDYVLDARFYGYSLINWDAIENNELKNVKIIRRANISPDRLNVTSYFYMLSGLPFLDPTAKDAYGNKYVDWSLWVPTTSEHGISTCGYGLLYRVALYEIFMRNNMGYNAEFVEKFVMPLVVGKTTKTEEHERSELEEGLKSLASSAVAVIDPTDEIELLEPKSTGTGYKSYDNFEARCEAKVSKIILGHGSAMESIPGKLGANDDIKEALENIQISDSRFVEPIINDLLFPKLREQGFNIPITAKFAFKNDKERMEAREKEDELNGVTATYIKALSDAGYEVDEKWITERTTIPLKKKELPKEQPLTPNKLRNRLQELYDN